MAKIIEATGDVASLFNGFAIALTVEILSGRLDTQQNSPGYQRLLDEFERQHPDFKPKTWQNLKEWLAFYNASKDIEILLAPVLLRLNQHYQDHSDQMSFSTNEIQNMTQALNIILVEHDEDFSDDLRNKIYLQHNGQNWRVRCTKSDAEAYIDQASPKLTMTSQQAFQRKNKVLAPTAQHLQDTNTPNILVGEKTINNPGEGNCAFYAFAIGLIDIIQYEKACGRRDMFDRWVAFDDSISTQYDAICAHDFDNPDADLLNQLQNSLRLVSYHAQRTDLQKAAANPARHYRKLVGTSIYNKFAELYHNPAADPRFNVLANSGPVLDAILRINRRRVATNSEHLTLVPLFLSLLYGNHTDINAITVETNPSDDSPIIESMGNITQEFFWGTHLDLDFLAVAFNVNFHPLLNGRPLQRFNDNPELHTITVNNDHNIHWTTQVTRTQERPGPDFARDNTEAPTFNASGRRLNEVSAFERAGMKNDQVKLEFLQSAITRATIDYVNYSNNIWFSLFHRHGNTGRVRAQSFLTRFLEIEDYDEAKKCLIEYLSNENNNGNTHPHSYRTMLLQEMQVLPGSEQSKPTLQDISKHFDTRLTELANVLDVRVLPASRPN